MKVPGMERYMWNKQRARQLAEEQQAREAKAFLQNPGRAWTPALCGSRLPSRLS